jgi:dinuclear metal center YbgI/SA1388 family protein
MKLNDVLKVIDKKIPEKLALKEDKVGYFSLHDENIEIKKIKVFMDIFVHDDKKAEENELLISHHNPLFIPKTPTYVIHSNWDIIKGGANDALANVLDLNVLDVFDRKSGIGRICSSSIKFEDFLSKIYEKLSIENIKIVNPLDTNEKIQKIAIVSGFGLNNMDYIKLASEKDVNIYLSGDLTQKGAILAKNLNLCLIDLTHHASEVPGLKVLYEVISEIGIATELIDHGIPWNDINLANSLYSTGHLI